MEFPQAGANCNVKECNLLDFLPVKCTHCNLIFCKDHAVTSSHDCKEFNDNLVSEKKMSVSYKCSSDGCKNSDTVEMNCVVCRNHFCLQHRHHGCFDAPPNLSKREKQRATKERFKQAKAETDKAVWLNVQDMLRNAKNRALANKIKLMKIKGSAVGDNQIPIKDRIFFLVAPPLQQKEKSCARGFFVNRLWTIGKSIDTFSKRLKVINKNDEPDAPKLRLFSFDGNIITEDMTSTMQSLLDSGILVDGDSLILEYVNEEIIDNNSYNDLFDEVKCSKYVFI
ncbi:hypothetical protein O3M35_012568 [Rhynocoris fuscipes]|uniref:AN1-type domain-containing protein n=1 Tax=Rhynocoris fuscipes TaxID=488301 RepID=A0AAW1CVZ6_9HEMI